MGYNDAALATQAEVDRIFDDMTNKAATPRNLDALLVNLKNSSDADDE